MPHPFCQRRGAPPQARRERAVRTLGRWLRQWTVGTMKTLATFLTIWVPIGRIGWVAAAHPVELRAVVESLMRTLGAA